MQERESFGADIVSYLQDLWMNESWVPSDSQRFIASLIMSFIFYVNVNSERVLKNKKDTVYANWVNIILWIEFG